MPHPADPARRYPRHQSKVGNVFGHHSARSHESVAADGMAAQDRGIGPDGGAAFDQRRPELGLARYRRARIDHIGEHAARAAKDVVFECHAFIKADIVLDLAVVADRHVRPDHDVLSDRTVPADRDIAENMTKIPYARAFADDDPLIDIGAFVNADIGEAALRCRSAAHERNRIVRGGGSPRFNSTGGLRKWETISTEVRTSSRPKPRPARISS